MTDWYKIKKVRIRQNGVEKIVRPPVPATAISLDKSSIKLTTVGQTSQITATLTPADSTSTVSWTSSNTSIATVSSTWLVTCVTPWTCTITATTDNWLTATCSVTNYIISSYTISSIPTSDTNKYINVARSWYTIQSVKFNFSTQWNWTFVHISSNNSTSYRYWVACWYNTSQTYWDSCAIRWRLWGSETWYRNITPFDRQQQNTVEFFISRNGNCYITVNWTKTSYTASSSELNVIQTIMNLSNMNCYASQDGANLSWNKVDIEVAYS